MFRGGKEMKVEKLAPVIIQGKVLVQGEAKGSVEGTHEMLSFWGGYDPATGIVVDRHHSLRGKSLVSKIVAMPRGKGSSTGSAVLLDAIVSENAPAGLLLNKADEIISLGIIVCEEFFNISIPIVLLKDADFAAAVMAEEAVIHKDGRVELYC
jgi:cis-L-3-hydroxyproline dehydratase